MNASAVVLDHVVKTFPSPGGPVTAISELTASLEIGRIIGVVGPDGAGKTTVLRLISGLLLPDRGRVLTAGFDTATALGPVQARVGYMPERFGLYEDLSVAENLRLYAALHSLDRQARQQRFRRLLAFSGLGPFTDRLSGRLSGGMKQKLGLACTLMGRPRILLLDEPSAGVDPVSRQDLWTMVKDLAKTGVTVVWSTAYLDEADACDDVILLSEGRLLARDPPAAFSRRMQGRVFAGEIGERDRKRLQKAFATLPGIIDARIAGDRLRLVLASGAAPPAGLATLGVQAAPTSPRFEDAFIDLLTRVDDAGYIPANGNSSPAGLAVGEGGTALTSTTREDPAKPVMEAQDLTRDFGRFRAVNRISFEVRRGEIFGLLGPNGAGKSTTFKMLCGLLPPSDGEARVAGFDMRRAPAKARARIGYMSQMFSLYGGLTVGQNLNFFAGVYGLRKDHHRQRVDWALDRFSLRPFADSDAGELPRGLKQRLALAACLMHEPEILFLDEPTSGVDPLSRRAFWSEINDLAASGVTVLVTTHFMDEAEYCDRLAIIYRGEIIASGSPRQLTRRFRTVERPEPTLENVFVALIQDFEREHPA